MRREAPRIIGAVACLAAAALLVLLAVDARAWSTRFPADDLRYRRDPGAYALWRPQQLAPFGLARSLLGVGDDLGYRRALQQFRLGRPLEPVFTPDSTTHRVQAEVELADFLRTSGDPARRSQAANLLGVLGFALATQDVGQSATFLNNAVTSFRQAIALDPGNEDALFNLEYALDQLRGNEDQQAAGHGLRGHRGQAGLNPTGQGY